MRVRAAANGRMAHECIQHLNAESVRLIYNSGSDVPMNLLRSRERSEAEGELLLSIISPADALSGVHVRESGDEIGSDSEEKTQLREGRERGHGLPDKQLTAVRSFCRPEKERFS